MVKPACCLAMRLAMPGTDISLRSCSIGSLRGGWATLSPSLRPSTTSVSPSIRLRAFLRSQMLACRYVGARCSVAGTDIASVEPGWAAEVPAAHLLAPLQRTGAQRRVLAHDKRRCNLTLHYESMRTKPPSVQSACCH
eukprot:1507885-Rhodomonas_salina.3